MTYIIAFVIIIVAAGAMLLFNQQAQAPAEIEVLETQAETEATLPEGYTPPTEQPPALNPEGEAAIQAGTALELDADSNLEVSTPEPDFDPADDQRVFTAEASYFTPRRTEHDIEVTLTLKDQVVVDANILYDGSAPTTPAHSGFDSAYASEVIGKRLNEIDLSRTGGASLTSVAFNEAVAQIKTKS